MKVLRQSFIILGVFIGICNCSSRNLGSESQKYQEQPNKAIEIDLGYKNLKLKGPLKRETYGNEVEREEIGCFEWTLEERDLRNILKRMNKVEPVEWNSLCYSYPCFYKGRVGNDRYEYEIEVNAASYIILKSADETLYFISENFLKNFLVPCNCCEEQE